MCPYEPKHMANSKLIRKDVLDICSKEEITIIKRLCK
jgi:hypothetical protein